MTEDELLSASAAIGLALDRRILRDLLPEVERVREAAQRLRDVPLDPEASPFAPDPDAQR